MDAQKNKHLNIVKSNKIAQIPVNSEKVWVLGGVPYIYICICMYIVFVHTIYIYIVYIYISHINPVASPFLDIAQLPVFQISLWVKHSVLDRQLTDCWPSAGLSGRRGSREWIPLFPLPRRCCRGFVKKNSHSVYGLFTYISGSLGGKM